MERLRLETGERIAYEPFQTAAGRHPHIAPKDFTKAVYLVEPGGHTTRGAEAVLRTLKLGADRSGALWVFEHVPGIRPSLNLGYRLVANNRGLISRVTHWLCGPHVGPPGYFLTRRFFWSCIAVVYLIAFLSLRVQIIGLIGAQGILPVGEHLQNLEQHAKQTDGGAAYWRWPTLVWLKHSDRMLTGLCDAGAVAAVLAFFGILPGACFALMWVIYLSLYHAGQTFLSFQWDLLLLETGFLAIFFAPWRLRSRLSTDAPPSKIMLWLVRLLLFKLMFLSGMVKLLDDHPVEQTWHKLEALSFHYETQCIPNAVAWYAHQLPAWFHQFCTLAMFVIELGVPFLIFFPRRPRLVAFVLLVFLQLLIILTGNYNFFNLLAIALCIPLLDDVYLTRILPGRFTKRVPAYAAWKRIRWPRKTLHAALATMVLFISAIWMAEAFQDFKNLPAWAQHSLRISMRTGNVNSYGLFRHMTTTRPEVVIEGSNDRINWLEYEFKYKPGDVRRRPPQVAPHQPRLDWQMWFAALSSPRHQPWIINFMKRLLEDSPPMVALLDQNPFPYAPPRFIRARLYQYHFTDWDTRRESGAWWTRTFDRDYVGVLSIDSLRREK